MMMNIRQCKARGRLPVAVLSFPTRRESLCRGVAPSCSSTQFTSMVSWIVSSRTCCSKAISPLEHAMWSKLVRCHSSPPLSHFSRLKFSSELLKGFLSLLGEIFQSITSIALDISTIWALWDLCIADFVMTLPHHVYRQECDHYANEICNYQRIDFAEEAHFDCCWYRRR